MQGGHAAQCVSPDDTPCNSHRSSYLRDYTYSEDRPHSAGVRPRSLLNKVASASHAIQRDDSDDENEPWVLEGWKDEASTVLENACQSAKLPSKYTSNMPCPLSTNVRRVASAATSRPKPPVHKQLAHGQRQCAPGAPDGTGLHSKQAGVRPKGATLNHSTKPPLGHNLEVGDESDVDPSTGGVQVASNGRNLGRPPTTYTPGSAKKAGSHAQRASTRPASASMPTVTDALSVGDVPSMPAPLAPARSASSKGYLTLEGTSSSTVTEGTPPHKAPILARSDSSRRMRSGIGVGEHAPLAEPSCVSNPLLEEGSMSAASSCPGSVALSWAPSTEHQEGGISAAHPRVPEWVTPPKKQLPSLHALGNGDGQPHVQQHQLSHLQMQQPEGGKVHHNGLESPLLQQPYHPQPQNLQQQQQQQQHHRHGLQPVRLYARSAAAAMTTHQPQWQSNRLKSADAVLPASHGYGPQTASLVSRLSLSPTPLSPTRLSPTRPQRSLSKEVGEHGRSWESLPSPDRARISLQPLTSPLMAQNPSPPQQQHHRLDYSPDHHHHNHHHQHNHLLRDQHQQQQQQPLQQAPLQHQQHLQQHDHLALSGAPAPAVVSPRGVNALLAEARLHRRPLPPSKPPPLPPSPMSQKAAEALLQHVRFKYGAEAGHLAGARAGQVREVQPKSQLAPSCSLPPGLVGKGIVGHGTPGPQHARSSDPFGTNPPAAALGRSPSLPTPTKGSGSSGMGQGLQDLMLMGQGVGGGVGARSGHSFDEQRGHGRRS